MDVLFTNNRIDQLIAEDVPYIDLTTEILGIGNERGEIEYFTREDCVLCGTEEVARMMRNLGVEPTFSLPSGSRAVAGETILRGTGRAADLHKVWKVGLNTLDHTSAVATKTALMVDAAHAVNPHCEILTTRKTMPGAKDLLVKAVTTGGAFPHRLGLSETVLIFDHHMTFMGGFDKFVEALPELRSKCIEKKLYVEADAEQARILAKAGVDGLQLDKVAPVDLKELVVELREIDPHLTIIATGGVNPSNVAAYAATGVDGCATTAPYTAKPIDMSARIRAL